jgi:hypothetical protein
MTADKAKKRSKLKVGSIFEIPLSDGRRTFGQYVFRDKNNGPLIQVFDYFDSSNVDAEQIARSKPLFPPIVTGLFAAIRTGMWNIVGFVPVTNFVYPRFISTLWGRDGKASKWFLWNGDEWIDLGDELLEEYKNLEFLIVYSPIDVVKRIETGVNGYRKLIETNNYF